MPNIISKMILRAIKVRLYPNKQQELTIKQILGAYRYVFNYALELKNNAYKETQTNLGLKEISHHYHNTLLKQTDMDWLRQQNTKVMKQAIRQVLVAYKHFFTQHKGFPKFKSKKDNKQSALFPCDAISRTNSFETKHISLITSLKNIRFRCSDLQYERLIRYKDKIKNATLSRTKTEKYFLSILVEMNDDEYRTLPNKGQDVGIDLGVKDFVITSDGEVFPNKHFFKRQEKKIAKLQRQLCKKQKGSNNRRKARLRLAKAYEKLSNEREDYIHCIVNSLLSSYDYVFMEDLNVEGMLKNRKLSKAIAELGFYRFKQVLQDKALLNNKRVVLVDRWFASSKTCHKCGYVYKGLALNEREWTCPVCGEHHDRDFNAAMNMLLEGRRMIGNMSS